MVELRERFVQDGAAWVWHRMSRTKMVPTNVMETPLKRCLTTFDITLLGIGHMVGAGIYVLIGTVAKDTAGPAIVLSFLLAGIASLLSAFCYAEFGARVPKAGSAYIYTYVTIGEFWAFVIGWNIILEHLIGAASVARAWSGYVDSLFKGAIGNTSKDVLGEMHETFLAPYPDPLAFCVTLIYCGLLTVGVKGSANINSIFTIINMSVMAFVIVVGFYIADIGNWQLVGGFAPYGLSGIIAGAATSFYAFVGFDSIATSSEEVLRPQSSIPFATMLSMGVVTIGYILVGAALTLMVPYYTLNPAAAIPDAFAANGIVWAKYIVSIGALCGMTTTLFGSLFSLPRCVYAMASDGLLFTWLAKVSDKTKVPVLNMMLCGLLAAIIALLFDIEKLVEFMSIGTLMAYTIVSACVVILRYRHSPCREKCILQDDKGTVGVPLLTPLTPSAQEELSIAPEDFEPVQLRPNFQWLSMWLPANSGSRIVSWSVIGFAVFSGAFCSLLKWGNGLFKGSTMTPAVVLAVLFLLLIFSCTGLIAIHQQNNLKLSFRVPCVPYLPLLSIFVNIGLMTNLNPLTWYRFIVWMAIGLILYFFYGIHNSKECEAVTTYSALLPEPTKKKKEGVFDTIQLKLATIAASTIASVKKATKSKETEDITEESAVADNQPMIEKGSPMT